VNRQDRLWGMGYRSDAAHLCLIFGTNYTPAYNNNLPQIDHIFAESLLRKRKNPNTGNETFSLIVMRIGEWRWWQR
jgi:hypothetical protein